MTDLTICIPVGPGHEATSDRAVQSVTQQTVEVKGLRYRDIDGMGAGYARNRLLERVDTPFVSFLDADDWLEPNFAEAMLAAIQTVQQGKYVYSGWFETYPDRELAIEPPTRCYCFDNGWLVHLVNAVVPTEWVRQVGGFDEQLPGMEDTDFFHRLHEAGHCGIGITNALVHYTADGNRSVAFRNRTDYFQIKEALGKRYHKETMSCCGAEAVPNQGPFEDPQPGDILAAAQGAWIVSIGRATGRIYPRAGHGQFVWVNPGDQQADPQRWRLVEQPSGDAATLSSTIDKLMLNKRFAPTPKAYSYTTDVAAPSQPSGPVAPSVLARMAGYGDE